MVYLGINNAGGREMKQVIVGFGILFVLGLLGPGNVFSQVPDTVYVKKVGNNWVANTIVADRGDIIVWAPIGTTAYYDFENSLPDILEEVEVNPLAPLPKKMKVKSNAPYGTYEYAIFCYDETVFAKGESPPKIIIRAAP